MNRPFVSVVIANYNGQRFLDGVLQSLRKQTFRSFETIVVDDGSTDDSVALIKKKYKWVRLERFEKNQGLLEALNHGIKVARAPYVLTLDNDTWFDKGWLERIVREAKEHPELAAIAANIWDRDKAAFRKAHPTFQIVVTLFGYNVWHDFRLRDSVELLAVGSGFTMYKKSSLPSPPFDPDYRAYSVDIALCFQLYIRGYKIHMVNSITHHYGGGTFANRPAIVYVAAERNRIMNFLIHYECKTIAKLAPLAILSLVLHNLYTIRRIHYNFQAYWWVVRNWGRIMEKRRRVERWRRVGDEQLTPLLSGRLFEELVVPSFARPFVLIFNALSLAYVRVVGIKTIESSKR